MSAVQRYQQRISGPLMDRVDIHLEMVRVPFQKLASLEAGGPSSAIRSRVETARKVQEARFRSGSAESEYHQSVDIRNQLADAPLIAFITGEFFD